MAQQQLTGRYATNASGTHATHGLSAFATITRLDGSVDRIVSQITAGASYVGAVPGRPSDVLTFGVARTHVNARAATAEELAGAADRPGSEYAFELGYSLHVAGWLSLQPNLQYIVAPGGYARADGVTVLGLKTAIAL
jgi:porin